MKAQLEPIFQAAFSKLKPRTSVPQMHIEFFPFAGLTHTARLRNDLLYIRVSDLLVDAPQPVFYSLALILLFLDFPMIPARAPHRRRRR